MARDTIHGAVRRALENDGWDIIADPYRISYGGTTLEADMRGEKLMAATRQNQRIIVEVKSLLRPSFINEFSSACGQYRTYVVLLRENGISDTVYMAVSHKVYKQKFGLEAVKILIDDFKMHLLIVDIEREVILEWID